MSGASLADLATKYFRQKGYKIEKNTVLEGLSGLPHSFDLVIRKGRERHLVWIRDWKRTVGVNIVIKMDKASADVGFPNPVMVSEKFSGHAKAYANRRGVTLFTKRQILRGLG
ncbi:restriction endonuclease [Candidatus Bathyarchaeota archaeon]|nr:restriction endonuclease [Candidatus Bathyarchaeota archaeon]